MQARQIKTEAPTTENSGTGPVCVPHVSPATFSQARSGTADSKLFSYFRRLHGAQGRNRTTDTVIFSHVLYQLSYLGAGRG